MIDGTGPADRVRPDRRRLLRGVGAAAAVGLAGCSRITGGEDGSGGGDEESGEDGGEDDGGVEEGDN